MNIQIRKYHDSESTMIASTGCEYPTTDDVKSQPISKMQAYINELVAENKNLKECIKTLTEDFAVKMQEAKEETAILRNQNKDLLVSLERLKDL